MIPMQNEKRGRPTHLKPEQPTQASGLVALEMVTESNNGQMELGMKENGRTIELMAKENLLTLTEIYMKETG